MNFRIFALLLALLLLSAPAFAANDDDNEEDEEEDEDQITAMTFLVEHQQEDENDHIDINILIKTQDSSLTAALGEASALLAKVTATAETYCENNPEDDIDCGDVVDAGDYEIQPKYQMVRKDLSFVAFIVTYQVTISVYHTQKIGELADNLLKDGVSKIQSFEWASSEEDDSEQNAIEAGKEKSHDMCFHLGMKLHRIISVEMVEDEGEQADAGGDEEQQQEEDGGDQQQQGPLIYRFEIECILDEETAARKAEEEAEEDAEENEDDDEDGDDEEDDDEEEEDEEEEEEEIEDEEEEEEEEEKPKKKKNKKK